MSFWIRKEVWDLWPSKLFKYWYKDLYFWWVSCTLDYFSINTGVLSKSHIASCPHQFYLTASALCIHYITPIFITEFYSTLCAALSIVWLLIDGMFCCMREEFVNNINILIISNCWFCSKWLQLAVNVSWACSVDISMCSL